MAEKQQRRQHAGQRTGISYPIPWFLARDHLLVVIAVECDAHVARVVTLPRKLPQTIVSAVASFACAKPVNTVAHQLVVMLSCLFSRKVLVIGERSKIQRQNDLLQTANHKLVYGYCNLLSFFRDRIFYSAVSKLLIPPLIKYNI